MRRFAAGIAALLLGASTAGAQVTQLTFEGLLNNEVIGEFYNGGLGGNGSGPGPSFGVTFGTTALALIDQDAGGTGNFSGQPSGVTTMYFPSATNAFMNVAGGFRTGFSTFYTAINQPGSIQVWSGTAGTGSLLGTLNLPLTPSTPGEPPCAGQHGQFCPFVAAGLEFDGTAQSIVFAGAANQIGFDNITFGRSDPGTIPGTVVPEPSTVMLLATGFVALAGIRMRRRTTLT